MKFLMINDEHELYKVMMGDLFNNEYYEVEEINRVSMKKKKKKMHDVHYSRRVNKFGEFPGKCIWNHWYELHKYNFDPNENYVVLFMNGSLRNYYNERYLKNIRKKHSNVKLALLIFDKSIYYGAKRAIKMRNCFDYVFSFDSEDCEKYGFLKFYNCFSKPSTIGYDNSKKCDAFFIGNAGGRLKILKDTFKHISKFNKNSKFFITGVDNSDMESIPNVYYNQEMSFYDEMSYSYNSNCLIEILREGQTGISLRVCEAIAFNKKLLTNNQNLKKEPFYDSRYMYVFEKPEDIPISFFSNNDNNIVRYNDSNVFSPLRICEKILEMEKDS